MRFLIATCLLAAVCHGQYVKPGPCPEFTTKLDFEIPPYMGKWYEYARFTTPDQTGQTCNYAEYADNGNGTVAVHNAGLEADGTYSEIYGWVEPSDVGGALLLHLNGVPVVGDYNVLDTDYEGYASVYSCQALLGLGHVEQAWILARTPALEQNKIDAAAAAFTNFGIDVNQFMATPQENCVFP
ncbi:apolipoprotein D [Penaeus vannamei]|uniref:Apolipoprotein D n=1 Tax=Penaeus vannamei TaxID=6689 RepID=A0A423SYK6_PENVA|nr:putative apolipoprotein D-like [Penaeus vannamei]